MNKAWMAACSAIVGCATAAMAQTASPAPAQNTPPTGDRKVTITGCLAPAPSTSTASTTTGAPGTAGTAGTAGTTATAGTAGTAGETAAAQATFQLMNATAAAADSAAPATGATPTDPASPPAAAAAPSAAAQNYRLIANPSALSPHVGKKVALTGTLENQDSAAGSAAPAAGADAKTPALRVESGKVLAEACAPQP